MPARPRISLEVGVAADTSRYTRGMRQVEYQTNRANRTLERGTRRFRDMGRAARNASNAIRTFGTVFAAGVIARQVASLVQYGDEIAKTSRQLGILGSEYQAIRYQADSLGIPFSRLTRSLATMQVEMARLNLASSTLRTTLRDLGRQDLLDDFLGAGNFSNQLEILSRAVLDLETRGERLTLLYGAGAGSGAGRLLQLIEEGGTLSQIRAEAIQRGFAVEDERVLDSAEDFAQRWTDFATRFRTTALETIVPILESMDSGFDGLGYRFRQFDQIMSDLPIIGAIWRSGALAIGAGASGIADIVGGALEVPQPRRLNPLFYGVSDQELANRLYELLSETPRQFTSGDDRFQTAFQGAPANPLRIDQIEQEIADRAFNALIPLTNLDRLRRASTRTAVSDDDDDGGSGTATRQELFGPPRPPFPPADEVLRKYIATGSSDIYGFENMQRILAEQLEAGRQGIERERNRVLGQFEAAYGDGGFAGSDIIRQDLLNAQQEQLDRLWETLVNELQDQIKSLDLGDSFSTAQVRLLEDVGSLQLRERYPGAASRLLTQEEYEEILEYFLTVFSDVVDRINLLGTASSESAKRLKEFKEEMRSFGQTLTGTVVEGLRRGTRSAEIFASVLDQALARLLEHAITRPAGNLLGDILGSIGTSFGVHGYSAAGTAGNPFGYSIPPASSGGRVSSGGLVRVGERGPETVALPRGATIYPRGDFSMNDAGGGVNITIVNNVEDPAATTRAIQAAIPRITQAATSATVAASRRPGAVRRGLRS